MALEGPRIHYTREDDREDVHALALRLARQIEELLEATPSLVNPNAVDRSHQIRMARAMAASLVDELEGIVAAKRGGPPSSKRAGIA